MAGRQGSWRSGAFNRTRKPCRATSGRRSFPEGSESGSRAVAQRVVERRGGGRHESCQQPRRRRSLGLQRQPAGGGPGSSGHPRSDKRGCGTARHYTLCATGAAPAACLRQETRKRERLDQSCALVGADQQRSWLVYCPIVDVSTWNSTSPQPTSNYTNSNSSRSIKCTLDCSLEFQPAMTCFNLP